MAQVMILANKSPEREGLALFMEMVGHQCSQADSLQSAVKQLSKEPVDVVLADASISDASATPVAQAVNGVAPKARVLILAEEDAGAEGKDEVITSPLTSVQGMSGQYPPVRQGEAFLMLLPEKDSLKLLADLPQTPGLLNKLALLHQSQQKYVGAEQLYKRALELSEKEPKDGERHSASILMNLAGLYHDQDRLAEAEPLYRRSLQLAEQVHGKNHPKVGRRLRRLVEVYRAQGKTKEAEQMQQRLQSMK